MSAAEAGRALQAEIEAKASRAPRVTPAEIEAEIGSEWYFTAAEGCEGAAAAGVPYETQPPVGAGSPLRQLTFCVLVLRNGFTVTGESACASPENFDAEIGRKVARENAINKVWPLLGFRLRDKLASQPADFRDRVRAEVAELDERIARLVEFLKSATHRGLPEVDRLMLEAQYEAMEAYSIALHERIAAFARG